MITDTATINHGYFYGTGEFPTYVLVVAATEDKVRYAVPSSDPDVAPRLWTMDRATFQLRADAGGRTVRAQADAVAKAVREHDGDEDDLCDSMRAWASRHGAPMVPADLDRLRVVVTGPQGLDVYGIAKEWGCAVGWQTDEWAVEAECTRWEMRGMQSAGLTVQVVRVLWSCPTA